MTIVNDVKNHLPRRDRENFLIPSIKWQVSWKKKHKYSRTIQPTWRRLGGKDKRPDSYESRIGKQSNNLEKAYKELLTLDQMKDKMIRDVSHELKSPVAQVQMAIDLWSKEVKKEHIDRSKRRENSARLLTTVYKDYERL